MSIPSWLRSTAAILAAGSLASTGLITSTAAQARPAEPVHDIAVSAGPNGGAVNALAAQLGKNRTGGVYLENGRFVIPVTDDAAEQQVRTAGAQTKRVRFSAAKLESVTAEFDRSMAIAGTSWGTDPITNQVVVQLDGTVSAADNAKVSALARKHGDAVRVEKIGGKTMPTINGGRYIRSGSTQCSLGFNVRSKSNNTKLSFLTAGHCTKGSGDWYDSSSTYIGFRTGAFYPDNDFGLVQHNNAAVSKQGNVLLGDSGQVQDISYSRDTYVGEWTTTVGYKSKVQNGVVQRWNVTVNYGDGQVRGLFQTTNCILRGTAADRFSRATRRSD